MKLIATDLDRTLVPNGRHKLSEGAMQRFARELKKNNVKLAYVTGRHKELIQNVMRAYGLPKPIYCLASLGTMIYKIERGRFIPDIAWQRKLRAEWRRHDRSFVANVLADITELEEQEEEKLNDFKQSYYTQVPVKKSNSLVRKIKARLSKHKIDAQVIYSLDANTNLGLIDVIPKSATKEMALKYLIEKLKAKQVMFSGDSGNDLLALTSGIDATLVKNAAPYVKEELKAIAKKKKIQKHIYIAKGRFQGLNGNYVSGVIEGAYHYGLFR